ncbi:unnamed protein product [Somion occarium]
MDTFKRGQLWMDDGNIILIAGDCSFRVHRSVLSRHSQVFKDMFTIPNLDIQSEEIDGVPIMRVSDRPSELCTFLSAMYDGISFCSPDAGLPFEIVVSLIRLGTKYQANHLQNMGLRHLHPFLSRLLEEEPKKPSPSLDETWKPECAITLVNLADSLDLTDILPIALYGCCQLEMSIVDGIRHSDDIVERLTPTNLKRCLNARTHLVIAQSRVMSDVHFCIAGCDCQRRDNRDECLAKTFLVRTQPHSPGLVVWNPLRRLDMWWKEISAISLCTICSSVVKTFYIAQRQRIISDLPEMFCLTSTSNAYCGA